MLAFSPRGSQTQVLSSDWPIESQRQEFESTMESIDAMNEDIVMLKEAWRNEKCGPELMAIDEDLIKRVLEQVEAQVNANLGLISRR